MATNIDAERERLARDEVNASIQSAEQRLRGGKAEGAGSRSGGQLLTEQDADDAAHAIVEQMSSAQRKHGRRLPDTIIGALVMSHVFTLLLMYYIVWRPSTIFGSFGFTVFFASTCAGLLFLTTGRTVESIAPEPSEERQAALKQRDHRRWLLQLIARRIIKLGVSSALAPFVGYLFAAKWVMRAFPFVARFIRERELLQARLAPLRAQLAQRLEPVRQRLMAFFRRFKAQLQKRRAQTAKQAKVAKEDIKQAADNASAAVSNKAEEAKAGAHEVKRAASEGFDDFVNVASVKAEEAKRHEVKGSMIRDSEAIAHEPVRG